MKPVLLGFYTLLIGLILAIACMNLANMLLARGASRRKELAIRLAVGASRFRLIRQMMTEGMLLSLMGGALGLLFAYWGAHLGAQMKLPVDVPLEFDFSLNWTAIVFSFALAVICGVGFSLAPALAATRADVGPALKEGAGVQLRAYRKFGMRNLLVVGQVAGSLMLLLITGFVVIGFNRVGTTPTRFDAKTMYLLTIDPVRDGYSAERAQALFEKLPAQLRQAGSVQAVALSEQPPFSIGVGAASVTSDFDAMNPARVKELPGARIGEGYFAALNEPILRGREFDDRDQQIDGGKGVAIPSILNASAAQGLFGNSDPIGRRITQQGQSYEVIGVVRDLRSGVGTGESLCR